MALISSLTFITLFPLNLVQSIECRDFRDDSCTLSDNGHNGQRAQLAEAEILCYGYESCYNIDLNAVQLVECRGYKSCAGDWGRISENGVTLCSGDRSCISPFGAWEFTEDVQNSAQRDMICSGDHACMDQFVESYTSDVYCNGNYGCQNATKIRALNGNINCDSFYACSEVRKGIEAGIDVNCRGYYSCYRSYIIAGGQVSVEANYGAFKTAINARGNVQCGAELSCANSSIHSNGIVAARSTQSAANSNITALSILGYGFQSLMNSKIGQIPEKSLLVIIRGSYAGRNTNIYCEAQWQQTCQIECLSTDGCDGTNVYYSDVEYLNTYPIDCIDQSGEESVVKPGIKCPNFIKLGSEIRRLIPME